MLLEDVCALIYLLCTSWMIQIIDLVGPLVVGCFQDPSHPVFVHSALLLDSIFFNYVLADCCLLTDFSYSGKSQSNPHQLMAGLV